MLSGIIKERATSSCFPRTLQHGGCTTGRCFAENASAVYSNTTAHEFFDHMGINGPLSALRIYDAELSALRLQMRSRLGVDQNRRFDQPSIRHKTDDGRRMIWFPLAAKVETRRVPAIHQLAVQPGCASVMRLPSIWSTFSTKAFGENGLARNPAPAISPPSCSSFSSE